MLGGQRFELWDERVVLPEREFGLDPLLDRDEPQVLEAIDLGPRERLVGEVGQGAAAPEPERGPERLERLPGLAGRVRSTALLQEPLESMDVDLLRCDPQHVAPGPGQEQLLRVEALTQPGDLDVEVVARGAGRPVGPQLVDHPVARDHLVGVQEQERDQRPLLRSPERNRPAVPNSFERPEQQELHLASFGRI